MIYTNFKIKQSHGPGVTPEITYHQQGRQQRNQERWEPRGRLRGLRVLSAESISQSKVQGRLHPQESSSPRMPPTPREGLGGALLLLWEGGRMERTGGQAHDYRGRKAHRRQELKSCALVLVSPTSKGFLGWGVGWGSTTHCQKRCCRPHNPAICTLGQVGKYEHEK